MENPVDPDSDVVLTDAYLAPGYGQLNDKVIEAMRTAAETEGLITDPVYTAKAMCGLIERAKSADDERTIVFLHTGGTPAIFGYERDLGAALDAAS